MWCVARFGTNLKNVKNTHGEVLILVKLQAKINTPPWIFFTFFKLYKWYQIALRITYSNYCPLTWMCHKRTLNNKTGIAQKQVLGAVDDNYKLNFNGLIGQDQSFTKHDKIYNILLLKLAKLKMFSSQ